MDEEARARVGVKFCGNCNPHIDSGGMRSSIERAIKEACNVEFVPHETHGLDLLLVISGCPVDCAERSPGSPAEIVVAGETVDRAYCPAGRIAAQVAEKMAAFSGRHSSGRDCEMNKGR